MLRQFILAISNHHSHVVQTRRLHDVAVVAATPTRAIRGPWRPDPGSTPVPVAVARKATNGTTTTHPNPPDQIPRLFTGLASMKSR